MTQETAQRRLAAILFADVIGYSRLVGLDESGTLRAVQQHRYSLIDPTIGQYQGRIVKLLGDGILVEFSSVHNAVDCAVAIQRGMIERNRGLAEDRQIRFRIGINLGDVVVQGDDILGDGVNIAARLQELSPINGVCISATVFGYVEGDIGDDFADAGVHRLKNIAKPVRAYVYGAQQAGASVDPVLRPFVDLPVEKAAQVTGGCLCGAVRYEINEPELGSMFCHCRMCQKFTGAPVAAGTTFSIEALRFVRGAPKFYRSSDIAERGFCGDCGTSLVYRGLIGIWTKWILVFTASLDNPWDYPPTYHLGIESKLPWLPLHDDLPRTRCADSPSLVAAYDAVHQPVP